MKSFCTAFVLLSFFWGMILAQSDGTALPQCASSCMSQEIPLSACDVTDQTCICSNVALQSSLTACVTANCTVKEGLTTQNITSETCAWPNRDQTSTLRNVSLPLFIITTIFIAARVVARSPQMGGSFGSDDYVIIAAWVLSIAFTILIWMLSYSGLGRDVWTLPFNNITITLKLFTALEKVYIPTVWITKISILLLYLRLFPDHTFRRNVKIGLALCSATVVCLFAACVFKCWPISFSWTYWDGEHQGQCSSMSAQGWANSSLNMFADIVVLLLPLPTIWKLKMSPEKKLSILSMFSVGLFVTVVSMVRLKTMKYFDFSANATWDFVQLSLWSAIEIYVGIICACMPGMRAFYTRIFRNRKWERTGISQGRATPSTLKNTTDTYGSNSFRDKLRKKNEFEMIVNETDASSMEDLRPKTERHEGHA